MMGVGIDACGRRGAIANARVHMDLTAMEHGWTEWCARRGVCEKQCGLSGIPRKSGCAGVVGKIVNVAT